MSTENESIHYSAAEWWLQKAEALYRSECLDAATDMHISLCLEFSRTHATLATAADVDRSACAEQRIAECVPDGGSRLNVAVAGAR